VDAVVTDPPYGINGGSGGDSKLFGKGEYSGTWHDDEDYIAAVCAPAVVKSLSLAERGSVTPGTRCLHYYPRPADIGCFWTPAAATHGPWGFTNFQPILYYGKDFRAGKGSLPSGRLLTEAAEKNGHPCPKPIRGWSWLVEKTSQLGETILDPFMGSGTTGVAALQIGRKFIGIELDPEYFAIACKRIEEAHKQPRLFPETKQKPAKTADMFTEEPTQ
jgi:DNA modification methylase